MSLSHNTPTVTQINRNFVIKWREAGDKNSSSDRLIGAGRVADKFGDHYAQKFFEKAMSSGEHKKVFKIRGKYVVTFSSK